MLSAAIVTTTSGRPCLKKTVESVDRQTYRVKHYIVTDGIMSFDEFCAMRQEYAAPHREFLWCSQKVGGLNLEARRLLGAMTFLVKEDVLFFLNDDDWYTPDHVESLMKIIEDGNDWAYSFRQIYDQDGKFVCLDECESLGEEHAPWNGGENFIETCSIAMKTEAYMRLSQIYWHPGWGPDRVFYKHAKALFPKFRGSKRYTMCFRVGGNETSVQSSFFIQGNKFMQRKYPDGMPWE